MSDLSERLKEFNKNRLPEMLPFKYEAMSENVFRFYRGTCHLFYEQLSKAKGIPKSPQTWICGDLHLENFGSYKADNSLVYFDLNDFDECIKAPALWEVLRLVTSIFLAFATLEINDDQAVNMAVLFVKTYSQALAKGKAISIEPRTAKGIVGQFLKSADRSTYSDILAKRTKVKKNKVSFSLKDERHFVIKKTLKKQLMDHVTQWINEHDNSPYNYVVKDAVFRLAGTGSIGVKRYLFLLKSTKEKNKYLIVDMKEALPCSLTPFVKYKQPEWESDAARVIEIQQRMQNMSSSMLSATTFKGVAYVMQELQPVKDTIKFKLIKDQYRDIYQVIDDMAVLTASSQLRSGGTDGSATIDELKAFGNATDWQEPVLMYAVEAAAQVKRDFHEYMKDYTTDVFV
jgi:uncharacterized protein (DUF2252 family)